MNRPVTWGALLAEARKVLAEPTYPRFEAEELLARAAGKPRAFFHTRLRDRVDQETATRFRKLVARRAGGEPLQYLLGEWDFLGRTFEVDTRALIPRGETEAIVEIVRELTPRARTILDAGTGSGILAVTLLLEIPGTRAVALDRSVAALALARRNAFRFGVEERLLFLASDWLSGLRHEPFFDVAVANPPYVPLADAPHLDKTVSEHEPPLALYGGDDGLDPLRVLLTTLPPLLRPGAPFVFELGYGQAKEVSALLSGSAFELHAIRLDPAGIPRTATAYLR